MSAPTHAAFLRAVNLGATRRASGADLREAFESMGFTDVATFRNSGNVVFAGKGGAAKLTKAIEAGLSDALGFEVPTFLRTASQLEAIAAKRPFDGRTVAGSKGKLQVALLRDEPRAKEREAVLALASDDDELELDGTELYWLPTKGTAKSDLGMKAIDRTLGLNTVRTHGTLQALAAKLHTAA